MTAQDVRDLLDRLAEHAPDPAVVFDTALKERIRRRRRVRSTVVTSGVTLAAAATVGAITVGQFGWLSAPATDAGAGPTTTAPPAGGPGDAGLTLSRTLTLTAPPGWNEGAWSIDTDDQRVPVTGPSGTRCSVRAYRTGAFDRARIPPGSAELTVNGRPGYFAEITNPYDEKPPSDPLPDSPPSDVSVSPKSADPTEPWETKAWTVVWEYAEHAWALSICDDLPVEQARSHEELLANATSFAPAGLPVPMRIGYLPGGVDPTGAAVRAPQTSGGFKYDYEVSAIKPGSAWQGPLGGNLFIGYVAGESLGALPGSTRVTVNGRTAWLNNVELRIKGEGFEAVVMAPFAPSSASTRAELLRIGRSLQFAPRPMDTGSWFDGRSALPE